MIELFSSETPNGYKASITLEELGLAYECRHIRLAERQQKQPWFLELNPNGRIPVIIDHDNDGYAVFESGAIMMYLAEKAGCLMPAGFNQRYTVIQWLMFQMGNLGPMMGQANVFYRYADQRIPYAISRYQRETRRLLEVLDARLQDRDYLAGDYSIADIANFCWARGHDWSGVDIDGLDNLRAWLERIAARPAVQRGLQVPADDGKDQRGEEITRDVRSILA